MKIHRGGAVKIAAAVVATFALASMVTDAGAQQPAFTRTVIQQVDISVPGREAVTALIEFKPGGAVGRHTHPGEEVGYVLEGSMWFEQDGKPGVAITAGQPFIIPAGAIHAVTNKSAGTVRVLSTYIVEKGKPLATVIPAK
jgi:quercetin dioxygenase-like cupin family protein